MTIRGLSRTVTQTPFPTTLSFDNGNDAIARGLEAKAGWRWSARRSVYAAYTRETISDRAGATNVRRGTPPHKVDLGGTTALQGLSFTLNADWQDGHTLSSQALNQSVDVPAYWRLDARLGWTVRPGVEVFASGQNLLKDRHVEFADGLVVPRTFSGGASVKF